MPDNDIQRPLKLDMTNPLDTAEATSIAAWRAKRTDNITWINDRHGHIAAIVSEDLVNFALRHGFGK